MVSMNSARPGAGQPGHSSVGGDAAVTAQATGFAADQTSVGGDGGDAASVVGTLAQAPAPAGTSAGGNSDGESTAARMVGATSVGGH